MGYVLVISGTLIALNIGFGYLVSEETGVEPPAEGVIEVQEVSAEKLSPAEERKNSMEYAE